MSHIFDALQRSEAERSGGASSSLASITELLEQAERGTAARLNPAADVTPISMHTEAPHIEEISVRDIRPPQAPVDFERCETLQLSLAPENRLVTVSNGGSPAAEAFRLLSVRLRHIRRERSTLKRLLITSSIPQEGKSMVSANLACSLAASTRRRVLLLEGDVRRPSLSGVFGLKAHPGLCEWLTGSRSLAASVYRLNPSGVWFLPAGSTPSNPLELLESGRLPDLFEQLGAWFDWIIIDSPPALPLADTSVWSRLADGILLVTRQGTTQKRHLERTLEAVDSSKLLGAVLNSSMSTSDNEYYSYYRPTEDAAE
jgi:capsular exopolysaccharide synthesis family protein